MTGINSKWLKENNIEIIDTPEAGDLSESRAKDIGDMLLGCDGAIITISAAAALSLTEKLFLEKYEREYPEKAEMVKNILLNDMKFEEYSLGVSQKGYMKYMVPIGCAAAGFGLSKIAGADTVILTVCTIAPAAAAYPVTINALRTGGNSRKKQMI